LNPKGTTRPRHRVDRTTPLRPFRWRKNAEDRREAIPVVGPAVAKLTDFFGAAWPRPSRRPALSTDRPAARRRTPGDPDKGHQEPPGRPEFRRRARCRVQCREGFSDLEAAEPQGDPGCKVHQRSPGGLLRLLGEGMAAGQARGAVDTQARTSIRFRTSAPQGHPGGGGGLHAESQPTAALRPADSVNGAMRATTCVTLLRPTPTILTSPPGPEPSLAH
jgi:hypothetical protein